MAVVLGVRAEEEGKRKEKKKSCRERGCGGQRGRAGCHRFVAN